MLWTKRAITMFGRHTRARRSWRTRRFIRAESSDSFNTSMRKHAHGGERAKISVQFCLDGLLLCQSREGSNWQNVACKRGPDLCSFLHKSLHRKRESPPLPKRTPADFADKDFLLNCHTLSETCIGALFTIDRCLRVCCCVKRKYLWGRSEKLF